MSEAAWPSASFCMLLAIPVLAGALGAASGTAWAKHHRTQAQKQSQTQPGDPCASLETSLQARISDMKLLEIAIEDEKHQPPKSVEGVIELLSGQSAVDSEKQAKLIDLRRQADTLNSFLKSQGCATVNIDDQLAKTK